MPSPYSKFGINVTFSVSLYIALSTQLRIGLCYDLHDNVNRFERLGVPEIRLACRDNFESNVLKTTRDCFSCIIV